jgi:phosphomannomutase
MVTASHNPPRYHGFKLFGKGGDSIGYDTGLSQIEKIVEGLRADPEGDQKPGGALTSGSDLEGYLEFLAGTAQDGIGALRVVVDASNGSAGGVFRALVHRIGVKAWIINGTPDGLFPNHGPNPLEEESRAQIAAEVVSSGADLGALLDGDGDRVIFVDETGRAIENYFMSVLIAQELLRSNPDAAIVYDLISSRVLPESISEAGGKPIISRVGYGFIHDAMVENGAIFGTETSGHVYFKAPDGHFTESAAYALVVVLNMLARRKEPLSKLVGPLRDRYAQAPELNVEVADREAAMRRVEEAHVAAISSRMDGISVSYPDYWFNVRPSNTEPILRLRLEAVDASTAKARAAEITALIES